MTGKLHHSELRPTVMTTDLLKLNYTQTDSPLTVLTGWAQLTAGFADIKLI